MLLRILHRQTLDSRTQISYSKWFNFTSESAVSTLEPPVKSQQRLQQGLCGKGPRDSQNGGGFHPAVSRAAMPAQDCGHISAGGHSVGY